jgi:hypothetical protein
MELAAAFVALQRHDPSAADAFDTLVALADETESRLDQAIVRLARAYAWRALRHPDADDAARDAQKRLAAIGTTSPGWARVFSLAAGVDEIR